MRTRVFETIAGLRTALSNARREKPIVGLVPTMGALHAGHGRLMEQARAECDLVVVSIFVNPIQFDRAADYEAYPRALAPDVDFCTARGVDVVFAPPDREMYPESPLTFVEVTRISDHLCGAHRPGHFRGVATVVTKLLNVVEPDRAYFGEKDAQQLAVVTRLVRDLNLPVIIVAVGTVREPDGLAISSRNSRLSPDERAIAPALYRALQQAGQLIASGSPNAANILREAAAAIPADPRLRLEYLEIVGAETMLPVERVDRPVRVAGALWVGDVRLIDNILCG